MHVFAKRGMHATSLILTTLLTELLGQRVFEKDLSSICCRGAEKKQKERREKQRRRENHYLKIKQKKGEKFTYFL